MVSIERRLVRFDLDRWRGVRLTPLYCDKSELLQRPCSNCQLDRENVDR